MKRSSILYALIVSLVFFAFLSFLEDRKTNVNIKRPSEENHFLFHQWVVAEAINPLSMKDETEKYATEAWQFFQNGDFVQFNKQMVAQTGKWEWQNGQVILKSLRNVEQKTFKLELLRRNELLLSNNEVKIRLLKIQ